LWYELFHVTPGEQPSVLIGQTLPAFKLQTLSSDKALTPDVLKGKPALLNIWATWCEPCSYEMPLLKKISEQYHVAIYGIDYKDNDEDAKQWLKRYGNPFVMTGIDNTGGTAIDLGVYGTPETFVIDPEGKIIYRHVGVMDEETWKTVLYPLIKRYQT
jgi:cytochrome c biogenesis protein CcmG/thiol:disulfide interchange protein DsbE